MAADIYPLSASRALQWMRCPAREYWKQQNEMPEEDRPVAILVGDMVHANITGHQYTPPTRVIYDRYTRNFSEAKRQVEYLTEAVRNMIELHDLSIVNKEQPVKAQVRYKGIEAQVSGVYDLICERDGVKYLVDLKTGVGQPWSAWVQLALYLWLIKHSKDAPYVDKAAVIFGNRVKLTAAYFDQDADGLILVAERVIKHYLMICESGCYPPVPSAMNCARCPNTECAVRAVKDDE